MTILTESFNTADSATLGPDLVWVEDAGNVNIVTNRAQIIPTPAAAVCRTSSTLAGNDVYAELVGFSGADGSIGIGPICRKAASATQTYYLAHLTNTGSWIATLYKVVAGTFTALGTASVVVTWVTGDTLRIEAQGTTVRLLINGVEAFTRTDSSIDGTTVGGKSAGIRFYDAAGSAISEADSFGAGDLGAAFLAAKPLVISQSIGGMY